MKNRGDIALYTTLIVSGAIIASALILTSILSQQAKFTHDIISSERAFYAANTGYEEGLYKLSAESRSRNNYEDIGTKIIQGTIDYDMLDGTTQTANYEGEIKIVEPTTNPHVCGFFSGTFLGVTRRLEVGDFENCWYNSSP